MPTHWVYKRSPEDIERHERERVAFGMSYYDWINFDTFMAMLIVRWADLTLEKCHTYPSGMTYEGYLEDVKTMREGFLIHANDDYWPDDFMAMSSDQRDTYRKAQEVKVDKALDLLRKHFVSMWD